YCQRCARIIYALKNPVFLRAPVGAIMLVGHACEPCKRVMQAGHHAVEPANGGAMCPAVIYK
ncbi:MAG: hypothetical protein VXA66_08440, partial [Alphaproteobacteria bacterium]